MSFLKRQVTVTANRAASANSSVPASTVSLTGKSYTVKLSDLVTGTEYRSSINPLTWLKDNHKLKLHKVSGGYVWRYCAFCAQTRRRLRLAGTISPWVTDGLKMTGIVPDGATYQEAVVQLKQGLIAGFAKTKNM